jgi:MoaA/NifB/PqqE/SkfB family radical SAM enzyme
MEETYIDIESFASDCKRLSELTGGQVGILGILGGEPLLHPQITDLLKIARTYFPKGDICITTNGLLLTKKSEEFWKCCNKYGITINLTKYPINLDFNMIKRLADNYNIRLGYVTDTDAITKKMFKLPLDLEGKQNIKKNYRICMYSRCICLEQGKIFHCPYSAHANYFNKHFNQDLVLTENDYIDIYKTKNIDEVFDFLNKPIPFCKYCKPKEMVFNLDWGLSKKEISEWT